MKKYISQLIVITIAFLFLATGGIIENAILQFIGCAIILGMVVISPAEKGILYVMAMVPNAAAYTVSAVGVGFLGLSFLLLFFKFNENKRGRRLRIPEGVVVISIYLLSLSFMRIFEGNYYDFALFVQTLFVVVAWCSILPSLKNNNAIEMIKFFRFGCVLMTVGMILLYPFKEDTVGRFRAILDDCNYTGGVCFVLLGICLLTYCYKLPLKNNSFFMFFAIISGLMTGSRGFLLSVSVMLLILLLTRSFGKYTKKFIFAFFVLLGLFWGLYLSGFGPAVSAYDNTIGRTMTLKEEHTDGQFMDVTSGRLVLWAYYFDKASNDQSILYFGRGFQNYFMEENGGFGLAAHNMFVSSIMGVGIIGTILILIMYHIIAGIGLRKVKRRIGLSFYSLIISITVNYFFLDGMLDARYISYFAIMVILIQLFQQQKEYNNTIIVRKVA